jgi:hypothetical protein
LFGLGRIRLEPAAGAARLMRGGQLRGAQERYQTSKPPQQRRNSTHSFR